MRLDVLHGPMLSGDPGESFRTESGSLGDSFPCPEADRLSLLVGDDLAPGRGDSGFAHPICLQDRLDECRRREFQCPEVILPSTALMALRLPDHSSWVVRCLPRNADFQGPGDIDSHERRDPGLPFLRTGRRLRQAPFAVDPGRGSREIFDMIPNLSYIEKVIKITIAKDSPVLYLLQGFLFYKKTPLSDQQKFSLTDFSLILATVIWGSDYPFAKIAMQEISPLSFSAARTLLATAALFPFFLMQESSWKVSRRDFLYLILLACFGTFLNRICWSVGLSLSTASNAALLMTTSPIFVLITSVLLFRSSVTWRATAGIAGCLCRRFPRDPGRSARAGTGAQPTSWGI